jgi:hypothetical protein
MIHISGSTDSASSMIEADSGLIHKIRQDHSYVIGVCYVAHRLYLSMLSSVKKWSIC